MIGGEKVITDRLGPVVHRYGRGLAIVNGGMESGVAPWYAYYGAQASISPVARTGAQSLRVTTPIVDRGVYQEVKDLVPGGTYEFRAWVRAESGTTLAALAVCDPNYNAFVWTGVQTVGTAWQMLSVTFTANSMGVARVHLAKHDTTGAQLWDDVELVNGASAVKLVRPAYYPYGQERGTATENDTAKFGTYTRDAATGLDYAMNRYYQSTWGRFTSPDPYRASGGPGDPGSWNRYAYVQGDPVNRSDPSGLYYCAAEFGSCLMQWDAGFLSTGGGTSAGGGTLGGPIGSPQCSGISGLFNPACWGPVALLPIAVPEWAKVPPPELCGVNPVTGTAGIAPFPTGIPGQLRPGVGGKGSYRTSRKNRLGWHTGIDISGIAGESAIYASIGGTVTKAADSGGAAGNTVQIDVGGGYSMWYMHLDSIGVKAGDVVTMGQNIGVLGQTGNGGGPLSEAHVHFEVRFGDTGYRDPVGWLNNPCPPGVNAW